jgi:hypothetical protein
VTNVYNNNFSNNTIAVLLFWVGEYRSLSGTKIIKTTPFSKWTGLNSPTGAFTHGE